MQPFKKKTKQDDHDDIHPCCANGDVWLKKLAGGNDEAGERKKIIADFTSKPYKKRSCKCKTMKQKRGAEKEQQLFAGIDVVSDIQVLYTCYCA